MGLSEACEKVRGRLRRGKLRVLECKNCLCRIPRFNGGQSRDKQPGRIQRRHFGRTAPASTLCTKAGENEISVVLNDSFFRNVQRERYSLNELPRGHSDLLPFGLNTNGAHHSSDVQMDI